MLDQQKLLDDFAAFQKTVSALKDEDVREMPLFSLYLTSEDLEWDRKDTNYSIRGYWNSPPKSHVRVPIAKCGTHLSA